MVGLRGRRTSHDLADDHILHVQAAPRIDASKPPKQRDYPVDLQWLSPAANKSNGLVNFKREKH